MTGEQIRARVAELLRAELVKDDPPRWYYISIANDEEFLGGVYLKARDPTEAHALLHRLDLYPPGKNASTVTVFIPDEGQGRVARHKDRHYRLLTREECELT